MGFSFVSPFLPFYIQELGIKDPHRVAIWAGLLGTAPGLGLMQTSVFTGASLGPWIGGLAIEVF